ncbi:MAG TPA: T9SS type A sorting domain-containing protein, partial [Niastella sp.]
SQVALIFPAEAADQANSYSFKEAINNVSVIYYRLKMVNKDGTYKISEVRIIRAEKAGDNAKIAIYPNPVTNNVNISIPASWQNKALTCQLLNINGHVIKSFTIQQAGQTASFAMTEIPTGMYFVKAISGKETSTQPIVKSANR